MDFDHLMNDAVTLIKKNGERVPFKGLVSRNGITTNDSKLPVEEGDVIERPLPNGLTEKFVVVDRGYYGEWEGIAAHYQMKVRREGIFSTASVNHVTHVYNLQGPNARVNISSTDASVNVNTVTGDKLFIDLREAIAKNVQDPAQRSAMLAAVDAMKQTADSPAFVDKYQRFVASAANHMTLLAPFIPALTQLLIR